MHFIGINLVGGPSLFHPESCVCASLALTPQEQSLIAENAGALLDSAGPLLQHFGTVPGDVDDTTGQAPALVTVASQLVTAMLRASAAYHGPARIVRDASGEVFHIALPEFNHRAEGTALQVAITAAIAMLPAPIREPFLSGSSVHDPVGLCQHFVSTAAFRSRALSIQDMVTELRRRGLQWLYLDRHPGQEQQIQIGFGRFQRLFNGTVNFETAHGGVNLSRSKLNTSQFLSDLGFPVTRQSAVGSAQEAIDAANRLGYPVVLKSDTGTMGAQVCCDLRSSDEVARAHAELTAGAPEGELPVLLVENHVEGEDYRITTVDGKFQHAVHREPAAVVGDGVHNIRQLVDLENASPLRGPKHEKPTYLSLQLGDKEKQELERHGLSPESVPERGSTIKLRANANWSSGGKAHFVDDHLHPDNRAFAERLARAVGITWLGIDVISRDISRSFLEEPMTVLEINHNPWLLRTVDKNGKLRNEAMAAVDMLMPNLARDYMPLILIMDMTQGSDTAEHLGTCLQRLGRRPAVSSEAGLTVNGLRWAQASDMQWADHKLTVVRNPEADIGVIERSPKTVLSEGLGVGGCDVAIVSTVSNEKTVLGKWPKGVQETEAAKLLLDHCKRGCVVDVDNFPLSLLAEHASPERLCLVSKQGWSSVIQSYCDRGAMAVVASSTTGPVDTILVKTRTSEEPGEMRMRFTESRSRDAQLSALGALLCLGISVDDVLQSMFDSVS
ncbi:MAG: acetate--CoA ligase family protein [Pseudomonadota bacterium]